jgi:hypothetical protein
MLVTPTAGPAPPVLIVKSMSTMSTVHVISPFLLWKKLHFYSIVSMKRAHQELLNDILMSFWGQVDQEKLCHMHQKSICYLPSLPPGFWEGNGEQFLATSSVFLAKCTTTQYYTCQLYCQTVYDIPFVYFQRHTKVISYGHTKKD